jgi:hypothetical protein
MRRILIVLVAAGLVLGAAATALGATIPEVRPFVGAFVPTGPQRDILKDTWLVGGQAALEIADRAHLVGSLAWAPNRTTHDVCVYDYTAGVEGFHALPMRAGWQFRPFLGLGLDGRTYVDHGNADHRENTWGGYGALGTEFQMSRIAIRLEGRQTVTRFKGLTGNDKAEARSDVEIGTGMAFHW